MCTLEIIMGEWTNDSKSLTSSKIVLWFTIGKTLSRYLGEVRIYLKFIVHTRYPNKKDAIGTGARILTLINIFT